MEPSKLTPSQASINEIAKNQILTLRLLSQICSQKATINSSKQVKVTPKSERKSIYQKHVNNISKPDMNFIFAP